MSQSADAVRQQADDFNAFMRGALSADTYAARFDPQVDLVWRDRQTYPDFPQRISGVGELMAFIEQYREGWVDMVAELLELIEAPGGRVLTLVRQRGLGRESGVPIVIHFFMLHTIRDGKVRKIEYFRHRADALKAAGLQA